MNGIERLVRIHRIRDKMIISGMVFTPLKVESFDMIVDAIGIRFFASEAASIVCLDYADESLRTIDSILEDERA